MKISLILITAAVVSLAHCEEVKNSGNQKKEIQKPLVFGDKFPEVLKVKFSQATSKKRRFSVTLSSKYDTPKRYADAWRVLDSEDNELGIRILGHDHANEQPFTRSGTIEIPKETNVVYVEGRDKANGWSGQRFKVMLNGSNRN